MLEYTMSFRRTRLRSVHTIVDRVVRCLQGMQYQVSGSGSEKRRVLSPNDLLAALKYFSESLDIPSSELIMSNSTRQRLLAEICITTIQLQHRYLESNGEIVFSTRHSFPAIGIELWLKCRPQLPSGFVRIRSSDPHLISDVKSRLLQIRCSAGREGE